MNMGKSFSSFWQKKQKIPDFYMKFGLSCILWSMGKFILKILGWKVKESWKKLLLQWYGLGKSFYCGGKDFRFYVEIFTPIPNGGGILDSPLLNRYPLFLKQREARQLETTLHFDKALKCSCFDTIKKFLGSLGKNGAMLKRHKNPTWLLHVDLPHVE